MLKLMIATATVVLCLASPANARRSYETPVWDQAAGKYNPGWWDWRPKKTVHKKRAHKHVRSHKKKRKAYHEEKPRAEARVVEHPAGCPKRAFCGCGTAMHIFGKPIRELWLAANWFKFPPAKPAPGMVAVRKHHVFAILAAYDDGTVLAYDPNSGGHKTRIHRRSLKGFSVRNPLANSAVSSPLRSRPARYVSRHPRE